MTDSLFEVEDGACVAVRDMIVGPATTTDVDAFCARYHYTKTGGSAMWRWGLWHGVVLHGVVAYNLPTRSVCASVFGEEHVDKVWHMGRLVCSHLSPKNSESRLIGGSLRAIAREHPEVWAVVTYAASGEGHIGTVYQATNALYCGTSDRVGRISHYIDQSGARRSTVLDGNFVNPERAVALGWTHPGRDTKSTPKHRYLYLLGSRSQRRRLRASLLWAVESDYPRTRPATSQEVDRG